MMMKTKPMMVLGLAEIITLTMTAVAPAQSPYSRMSDTDTWTHTVHPRADGKCWVPSNSSQREHNHGYWGNCPASAASSTKEARAEAVSRTVKHTRKAKAKKLTSGPTAGSKN